MLERVDIWSRYPYVLSMKVKCSYLKDKIENWAKHFMHQKITITTSVSIISRYMSSLPVWRSSWPTIISSLHMYRKHKIYTPRMPFTMATLLKEGILRALYPPVFIHPK